MTGAQQSEQQAAAPLLSVRAARTLSDEEYRTRAYRRGPKWALPVLLAVVVIACVGLALGYYRNFGSNPLQPQITAFHIQDRSISATFTVTRNHSDRAVSCVLQAQAHDHAQLGTRTVTLPAGGKRPSASTVIATPSRPYAAEVQSCRYLGH